MDKNDQNVSDMELKIEALNSAKYNRVYALNGYKLPEDKDTYDKYTPLSRLNPDELVFVSPKMWSDPYETRFYDVDYSKRGLFAPELFCMCLTSKQATNEDAMWRMYAVKGEEMVKARVNIQRILDGLDKEAQAKKFKVYIGNVEYISATELRSITLKSEAGKHFFRDSSGALNMSLCQFLSLMSLKRVAFSYENEVRIFIVPDEDSTLDISDNLAKVSCSRYITDVTVSPYPVVHVPFPYPDNNSSQLVRRNNAIAKLNLDASHVKKSDFFRCPKLSI